MGELNLSGHDQQALRAVMAAEPVPGRALPEPSVLEALDALVPCDQSGIVFVDGTGLVTASTTLAPTARGKGTVVTREDLQVQHGGPFYIGVMHWRRYPTLAEDCGIVLTQCEDALAIGYRNGTDHVVQYWFRREHRHFSRRDLDLFELLLPSLQRLARERPTPSLPSCLTITERRILNEVAAGYSNAEIAEGNHVTVSTVRKHLENAYRKLGVSNRLSAIARVRGSDQPGLDLRERVERFA